MRINRTIIAAAGAAVVAVSFGTAAQAGACRDPWITQAIREVTGREPNGNYESGECAYTQYGGGRWNSYGELKGYVQQKLRPTISLGPQPGGSVQYRTAKVPNAVFATLPKRYTSGGITEVQYQGRWWRLVGPDGASMKLVGPDGGS